MRLPMRSCFVVVLFALTFASAQEIKPADCGVMPGKVTAGKISRKTVRISGLVGDVGTTFVDDKDNKMWTVGNPDTLKALAGHHVMLKAHLDAANNEIQVTSVKIPSDEYVSSRRSDIAFVK